MTKRLSVSETMTRYATKKAEKSLEYLIAHKEEAKSFPSVEDFAVSVDACKLQAFEHHFINVRSRLCIALWQQGFYVGVSVIDSLLFGAVVHSLSDEDPVRQILTAIRDFGVHKPGFVVYPVHSAGILGLGLFRVLAGGDAEFRAHRYGLVLSPQSNSFDKTVDTISSAAHTLGISRKVPVDLLEHWRLSRPTKWLECNPLLIVRISQFPGEYYENQRFLIIKLQLATSLIFMFAALQESADDEVLPWASSSKVGNFSTLDLRHYLIFYPRPSSNTMLDARCVPMNFNSHTLAELSDVPVDLDPKFWKRPRPVADRISACLQEVESGYVTFLMKGKSNTPRDRLIRKLFDSLRFFRRSFRRGPDSVEEVVNLASAFEILLTDSYAPGIEARLKEHARAALRGVSGMKKLLTSLDGLYVARSEYLHGGRSDTAVDVIGARKVFTHAFLNIAEKLSNLPKKSDQPIRYLLGLTKI